MTVVTQICLYTDNHLFRKLMPNAEVRIQVSTCRSSVCFKHFLYFMCRHNRNLLLKKGMEYASLGRMINFRKISKALAIGYFTVCL